MKRIFITIMAAAAVLASCDNAEVAGLKGKGTFMLQSVTANTDLTFANINIQTGIQTLMMFRLSLMAFLLNLIRINSLLHSNLPSRTARMPTSSRHISILIS